jgi:pyruvate-formate lyase-activating enzyme
MSTFNIHKNKAICVLPWVHEHLDLNGEQRPCCYGNKFINNRNISNIRQEMLQGKYPVECSICYKEESNNESSTRIRETIDWLKKFGEPNINSPIIQYLDIRNDPTCNLKCKTCGPHASTLWAKEKNVQVKLPNYDLTKYDKTNLKKIYFAGGEPTYNKSYLNFLIELLKINPNCEVMINTNLKRLPDAWKNLLSSFKNLTVTISCDAIEELGCYVRYPLEWSHFEENVKFVSERASFTMFNLVPSNLTVHTIDRTVEWMKKYSNNISLTVVGGDHWEHRAVPMEYRSPYIDSLKRLVKFPISNWFAHKFRMNLNSLITKYESNNYDPALHLKLKNEVQEQDSHRTTQLKDVDPFLYSWIFNK